MLTSTRSLLGKNQRAQFVADFNSSRRDALDSWAQARDDDVMRFRVDVAMRQPKHGVSTGISGEDAELGDGVELGHGMSFACQAT
jgi:hypothetical protein